MKDIPAFSTQNGVASLILKEIPYKGVAYIRIQSSCAPELLLEECVDFCKAVGATYIYATGCDYLEKYPFYTEVWNMTCTKDQLPEGSASLFPVQDETADLWREIYNIYMKDVPLAATLTRDDLRNYISEGGAYFVHQDDVLLGIGKISDGKIDAIISNVSGKGADILLTLANAIFTDQIIVEVATENAPAVKLYEKLGFIKTRCISKWFKIV